jgi:hypothetical protein
VPEAGNPQALNQYAYGHNNPVKFVDPSGHFACEDAYGDCGPPSMSRPAEVMGAGAVPQSAPDSNPVQPYIDWYTRFNNLVAWPAAVASQSTKVVETGPVWFSYTPPRSVPHVRGLPNVIADVPSGWATASKVGSYGLPFVGGALNAFDIHYREQMGEINANQAYQQQVGNMGFTAATSLAEGVAIPTAAAATSNPVGWAVAGTVAFGYDISIAQGTFNKVVEGQPLNQAFYDARVDTNEAFGLGWIDTVGYEMLSPALSPVLTPIAKSIYGIP